MKKTFFTPGPSELYFTVEQHIKTAIKKGIPSISHRGKEYVNIHQKAVDGLKELVGIPDNFTIGFTSSATEVWERTCENLVDKKSFHLVNGSFSEKFYQVAKALGKDSECINAEPGNCSDVNQIKVPEGTELIGLAQNETSTGAALPLEDIAKLRTKNPDSLLAIDAVSAIPVPYFDFNQFDMLYFSVQKCFGLPAGLGVWIFNDRCIAKAEKLKTEGKYHDTYNGILNIAKFAEKHQTSCTPNVLNIYLISQVIQDMLTKGVEQIRQESAYKSALIYSLFEKHSNLTPFVSEKRFRSMTVGVAEVKSGSESLIKSLDDEGMQLGNGYGPFKNKHIRIANFPTHSKEHMEMLVDKISAMDF